MSAASQALDIITRKVGRGLTLDAAVRELTRELPHLVAAAQEDLGAWPGTDKAVRALQDARVPWWVR